MERKEFLSLLGLSTVTIFAGACLAGCGKQSLSQGVTTPPPTGVDFTLDLSLPANATLNTDGGYVYSGGIIVARTTSGTYIAVSQACTHQGVTVQYVGSQKLFYCPSHGATFADNGAVISGPTSTALAQYKTSLSGSMLRVYS